MATPQVQINSHLALPPIAPYLSDIAHKKIDGVALTCFEAIAHWFLTVFSCFYPAYNNFYNGLTDIRLAPQSQVRGTQLNDPNPAEATAGTYSQQPEVVENPPLPQVPDVSIAIEEIRAAPANPVAELPLPLLEVAAVSAQPEMTQEAKDAALLDFFNLIKHELGFQWSLPNSLAVLRFDHRPKASLEQQALTLRTWMNENGSTLQKVSTLNLFSYFKNSFLPPELDLFPNLSTLHLSTTAAWPSTLRLPNLRKMIFTCNTMTELPPILNDHPTLTTLAIDSAKITQFPDGFNPMNLRTLILSNMMLLESLPPSLSNHEKLEELSLDCCPRVPKLPEGFNPEQLKTLDLRRVIISELPQATKLPNLETFMIQSTWILWLPRSFNPPNLDWTCCADLKKMRKDQQALSSNN